VSGDERVDDHLHAERATIERARRVEVAYGEDEVIEALDGRHGADSTPGPGGCHPHVGDLAILHPGADGGAPPEIEWTPGPGHG
jgi:hypothetical protein